jgi:hypothetical protein
MPAGLQHKKMKASGTGFVERIDLKLLGNALLFNEYLAPDRYAVLYAVVCGDYYHLLALRVFMM